MIFEHQEAQQIIEVVSETTYGFGADVLPLGACALSGTTLSIDRQKVAAELGFSRVSRNSMDSVSDRDFLIEYAFSLALIATHISNICEDMIIWASAEYAYITVDEDYCTGSSIMPQKKNPDVHELLRGKTARVHSALYSLLTLMKGLPQAYNRDMQEDKECIFDSHDTVNASVKILRELVAHTHFNESRLLDSTQKGYMEATALAEYLVKKGVAFRDAHHIVGRIVRQARDVVDDRGSGLDGGPRDRRGAGVDAHRDPVGDGPDDREDPPDLLVGRDLRGRWRNRPGHCR